MLPEQLVLAVFALGILRAYGLMGAHFTGLRAWLGPRQYSDISAAKPRPAGSLEERAKPAERSPRGR